MGAREDLANVKSDIEQARTVIQGASIFVDSVPALVQAAADAAMALGATAEEVRPVSELSDLLESEAAALKAKMTVNTPPVSPGPQEPPVDPNNPQAARRR